MSTVCCSHTRDSSRQSAVYIMYISFRYYGGSTNLLTSGGIAAWQPTVAENPWLFSGELVPISNLISDITKRRSMEHAVLNHRYRAMLREDEQFLKANLSTTSKMQPAPPPRRTIAPRPAPSPADDDEKAVSYCC